MDIILTQIDFGEIIATKRIGIIRQKIENFSHTLSIMKGREYIPDGGDYAFIVSLPFVRKVRLIPNSIMYMLKKNSIELIFYKEKNLRDIPGLGSRAENKLKMAGIYTIKDLLECNSKIIASKIMGIGEITIYKWKQAAIHIIKK